jgi:hypothetical protein
LATLLRPSSISNSDMEHPSVAAGKLLIACLAGVVAYLLLFCFCIDKPLTTSEIGAYLDYKMRFLSSIQEQRKIAIFSGSNGRYSHSCAAITRLTSIPCANLSTAAGYDLEWQLARFWPYLRPGDVLYLPLEYGPLKPANGGVGAEAAYIVRHDHAALGMYTARQLLDALFYFDVRYLISGIGEMALQHGGVQRRTSVQTLDPEGDEQGATSLKAEAYRSFVSSIALPTISLGDYDAASVAVLTRILEQARAKGILVVGGLPTTFTGTDVPAALISRLQSAYQERDACFVVLPNRSLYPRSEFFDTEYHLQESAQFAHSSLLAPLLARIWHDRSCQ